MHSAFPLDALSTSFYLNRSWSKCSTIHSSKLGATRTAISFYFLIILILAGSFFFFNTLARQREIPKITGFLSIGIQSRLQESVCSVRHL